MWITLSAAALAGGWSAGDWVLRLVVPLLLLVAGAVVFLRGRAAYAQTRRLIGGFGGPPGSLDIGTELGFGVDEEEHGAAKLSAQRQMLWGGIVGGVGLIWLLVTVFTTLL